MPLTSGQKEKNQTPNQQIFRVRRQYNQWVVNQTLEDYALRFTAKKSRYWSAEKVAMTALGAAAFLALEAIGGAITLNYGFTNAVWAIALVSFFIFITGLPICYYASRYGVDIDLLTRGAGFGYLGSTITSLIYASFTFIFFAIEAVILSSAIEALFGIPLYIGYIISSVLVIPIVTHGITFISKFQIASQPVWLTLQILALIILVWFEIDSVNDWTQFSGIYQANNPYKSEFNIFLFGAAASVLFALIAQNGEQVDYLRFLPVREKSSTVKWWAAMIFAGPGWIFIGIIKLLIGSFIAYLSFSQGFSVEQSADPVYMYTFVFNFLTQSPGMSLVLAGILVITCQMKINVTNAYAGSIAWSNFFSRLTHNHPGRVVWLIFNVAIALLLMELGIYRALENILSVFAIVAVAWLGTIATDLTINKILGLAPKGIEFKRAHLYDINPVGIGSLLIASIIGLCCYLGFLGEIAKALTHFITLGLTAILAPTIAWLTKSKYYIARQSAEIYSHTESYECCICAHHYEPEDMSHCPAYRGSICSLCCSLDARCLDACKTHSRFSDQITQFLSPFLPHRIVKLINSKLMSFISITLIITLVNAGILSLIYYQIPSSDPNTLKLIANAMWTLFFILFIITGVLAWLFVLAHGSRIVAQQESHTQTVRLLNEIEAHDQTDKALQEAIAKAEASNQAKSRYLSGISHELRTPLQTILGYAQLLSQDKTLPDKPKSSIEIIQRSGDHLADLIEGLLDVSKIEAGKLEIRRDEMNLDELLNQINLMFKPLAEKKNIDFIFNRPQLLPTYVIADEKRIRQILINLLSNAIKFTEQGSVEFSMSYKNQVAEFKIKDTGFGISKEDQERIFRPFERATKHNHKNITGTGLGLTIVHLLVEIMGGNINLKSEVGKGSCFTLSLMLSSLGNEYIAPVKQTNIIGYTGTRKTLFIVDDEENHLNLMEDLLKPIGFDVVTCQNADQCIEKLEKQSCDLFLLDVSLPGMSGIQLSEYLRKNGFKQAIIMISAEAQEHHEITNTNTAHNYYMVKPIKVQSLLDKIRQFLSIEWEYEANKHTPDQTRQDKHWRIPDHPCVTQLIAYADIGYAKGFNNKLIQAEEENILASELVQYLYQLAKQVRFDKITTILNTKTFH